MDHPRFISGDFDTRFIEQECGDCNIQPKDHLTELAAIVGAVSHRLDVDSVGSLGSQNGNTTVGKLSVNGWKSVGKAAVLR